MGPMPEVVTLPGVGGQISEVPLPEVELLKGWVPPEGVTQVYY